MKINRQICGYGRIGGLLYSNDRPQGEMLVLFNQWRSGAASIFSQYLAKFLLEKGYFSHVLFIDRIASGGSSDNKLSQTEKTGILHKGEQLFAELYAEAITAIIKKQDLPEKFYIGGSSAGGPAALAAGHGFIKRSLKPAGLILVEPSGLMNHGIGKKRRAAVLHAFVRHSAAYRHRLQRGWWTPMDKEQYFAKGNMFEFRAKYWASDKFLNTLVESLNTENFPPIKLILSTDSHVHTEAARSLLAPGFQKPHKLVLISGNHDKICQPPSLSELYKP